jgi:Flp pilus assembly protein TadB
MDVLSAEDRRKLEAIERGLSRDDPSLARALARGPQAGPGRSRRTTGLTVVAAVVSALVAGLLLGPGVLVIGAFLLLIGMGFNNSRGDDPRPWRQSGA